MLADQRQHIEPCGRVGRIAERIEDQRQEFVILRCIERPAMLRGVDRRTPVVNGVALRPSVDERRHVFALLGDHRLVDCLQQRRAADDFSVQSPGKGSLQRIAEVVAPRRRLAEGAEADDHLVDNVGVDERAIRSDSDDCVRPEHAHSVRIARQHVVGRSAQDSNAQPFAVPHDGIVLRQRRGRDGDVAKLAASLAARQYVVERGRVP